MSRLTLSAAPRFQGQYTIGHGIMEQKGQKYHNKVKQTLEKGKNQYPDDITIYIDAQNGFTREGRIYYTGDGSAKSKEFTMRKIPIFDCFPVPVGPELETGVQFAKRLIQQARKLAKEWNIPADPRQ